MGSFHEGIVSMTGGRLSRSSPCSFMTGRRGTKGGVVN